VLSSALIQLDSDNGTAMLRPKVFFLLALLLSWMQLTDFVVAQDDVQSLQRGRVVEVRTEHGTHQVFRPSRFPDHVLVIAHGTPGSNETTASLSKKFIDRWTKFAKRANLLLIAPAFDRQNFGADPGTGFGYGGYRGLFGRNIGSDEFVIGLVEHYQQICKVQDGRFLLYGHSAGGQFAIRFAVRHPSRIAAVIASAPGRFAYPTTEAKWPYGMGKFKRTIKWDANFKKEVAVEPDADGWNQAAQLPMWIIYGEKDLDRQPNRPAHTGNTRISFAKGWIESMNELLPEGEAPSIDIALIPGIGHSSSKLTPFCQKALTKTNWVQPSPLQMFRKWKNKTGRFSVEAIFVQQNETKVQLKKLDGTTLSLDKSKLGKEDQAILEEASGK